MVGLFTTLAATTYVQPKALGRAFSWKLSEVAVLAILILACLTDEIIQTRSSNKIRKPFTFEQALRTDESSPWGLFARLASDGDTGYVMYSEHKMAAMKARISRSERARAVQSADWTQEMTYETSQLSSRRQWHAHESQSLGQHASKTFIPIPTCQGRDARRTAKGSKSRVLVPLREINKTVTFNADSVPLRGSGVRREIPRQTKAFITRRAIPILYAAVFGAF